ncbi:MAG: hypothetical protein M0Z41_01025 [Peptococcaceae bacterium]|jgi:hypothetical protein|nr:hypothetical protein [Peptococcaceae bacterium]
MAKESPVAVRATAGRVFFSAGYSRGRQFGGVTGLNEDSRTMERRVDHAIARLRALRESDLAALDLVSYGQAAVGPLGKFLFTREPGGLFQARRQAVEILAALGAKEILINFLAHPRVVADPVEQAGEDAVISAVAQALTPWQSDEVFSLLLEAADRKLLAGIVAALGEYGREDAMPVFAAALGEDFCRAAGEEAFRKMGACTCPYLLQLADCRTPSPDDECESSRRRRRSALGLFGELYQGGALPGVVRSLVADTDSRVAAGACGICLPRVSPAEREKVAARLVDLLAGCDLVLRAEIEDLLVQNHAG